MENNSIKVLDDYEAKIKYNDMEISLTIKIDLLFINLIEKNSIYIYENNYQINNLKKMKYFSSINSTNEIINSILNLIRKNFINFTSTDDSISLIIQPTMEKLILNKKIPSIESIIKYFIKRIEILENNLLETQNFFTKIINNYEEYIDNLQNALFNNENFMKNLEKKIKKQVEENIEIIREKTFNLTYMEKFNSKNKKLNSNRSNYSLNYLKKNNINTIKNIQQKNEYYPNKFKKNLIIETNNINDDIFLKRTITPIKSKKGNDQLMYKNHKTNRNSIKTNLSNNNKEKQNQ
jgi:hypothetical protein